MDLLALPDYAVGTHHQGMDLQYLSLSLVQDLESRAFLSADAAPVPNPAVFVEDRVLQLISTGDQKDSFIVAIDAQEITVTTTATRRFNRNDLDAVVMDAGPGDDWISLQPSASPFPVTIQGGAGNDRISLGRDYDFTISGEAISVFGGDGDEEFWLRTTLIPDVFEGGAGVDEILGDWHQTLDLRNFVDVENAHLWAGTIIGNESQNRLYCGTIFPSTPNPLPPGGFRYPTLASTIYGNGGDDIVYSGNGPSTIDGGTGDDWVHGADYVDRLYGGPGNDTLEGVLGDDRLEGGDGDDTLNGGGGDDVLNGRAGRDRLYGGDGRDRLAGNGGHDFLFGESNVDRLYGGAGNDRLDGGSSGDRLQGDSGADILSGQGGDDRFYCEDSIADQLFGGSGSDTAVIDDRDLVSAVEQPSREPGQQSPHGQ